MDFYTPGSHIGCFESILLGLDNPETEMEEAKEVKRERKES